MLIHWEGDDFNGLISLIQEHTIIQETQTFRRKGKTQQDDICLPLSPLSQPDQPDQPPS